MNDDHQPAAQELSGYLPVQAPQKDISEEPTDATADETTETTIEEVTEAITGEISYDSEDDLTPTLRPRQVSAPPALGLLVKARKAQIRRSHLPIPEEQASTNGPLPCIETDSLTNQTKTIDTTLTEVVSRQEPNADHASTPTKSLLSSIKNEALPEATLDVTLNEQVSDTGLDFQVFDGRKKPTQAYLIKHVKESVNRAGQAWQVAKKLTSIKNKAGIEFKLNDIVDVCFEPGNPEGTAEIIEIREKSGTFVLCQWLYTRAEAVRAGAARKDVKSWPLRVHMLSNHYQVLGDENLHSISDVKVDEKTCWDATGQKTLRPLSEIAMKFPGKKGK